ncbi:MAG: sugar transferase [Gemmatimonadota bacterium]
MHSADPSLSTATPARRAARRRAVLSDPQLAPETRVVVIGQAEDLHRALTHPAVEAGRFVVVEAHVLDVEVGLADHARRGIEHRLESFGADALLFAGTVGPSASAWATDVAIAHGIPLWAVMPTEMSAGADPRVVWPGGEPLLQLAGYRRSRVALAIKRGIDVVGALVGIVVSAPVMLVVVALIRLESRGWPLFLHTRVTRDGHRFGCLKLRTMHADAEAQLEADDAMYADYVRNNYKIPEDQDPRITRLGRFLRRTSLDEVPQFWNVLSGEMSLVGPRPLVPSELEHYTGARQRLLLSMRPGLTGAWAVSGRHGVGYPERCEIELGYVRSWSLLADARVLLRTIRALASY